MKKMITVLLISLILVLALSACSGAGTSNIPGTGNTTPGTLSPGSAGAVGGIAEFIDAIKAAGATVETGGTVQQPFFNVAGQEVKIDGESVQVFEFADETTRTEISGAISHDASQIGTSIPSWISTPHIWAQGRLIVLYVGTNDSVLAVLNNVLGVPIAEGTTGAQGGAVQLPPQVDQAVKTALAALAGSKVTDIKIVSIEQQNWPDACLGLAAAGEACATVITPGFRVVLEVNGQQYAFRTNLDGTVIREETR